MYILEKIRQNIAGAINAALKKKLVKAGDLVYPPNPDFGDISLPCFNLAKELKKTAVETGEFLVGKVEFKGGVVSAKAIGPFLNFSFDKTKLAQGVIEEILKSGKEYGFNKSGKNKKIMLEFACPNTHKAFHIGHLRNLLTGESAARILQANGYEIIRVNYQGDVGPHIAKCLWGILKMKQEYGAVKSADSAAKAAFLGAAYARGSAAYETDESAKKEIIDLNKKIYNQDKTIFQIYKTTRKWSLDYFGGIYKKLNTKFDRLYFESEVFENGKNIALKNLKKGVFKKSHGAVIFEGEKYGLHSRVFINSEGNPTYEAKDLGLAELQFKHKGKPDKILHVVGPEQSEYLKVIIKALEIVMPKSKGREEHLRYGWVRLKDGKMSSRLGNVILGEWILSEAKKEILEIMKDASPAGELKNKNEIAEKVSLAAVKYSILKSGIDKDIVFDLKESVNLSGSSGPYLQYAAARINSILRKIRNAKQAAPIKFEMLNDVKEFALAVKLAKYPEIVEIAGRNCDPSEIAKYLFELAQEFNDYYHSAPVLKAKIKIRQARLALLAAVKQALENGMELLGIESVEKM